MRRLQKTPLAMRGSVLLIVLVTLVFATSALLLFIDKASTDLLVPIREADASKLRLEAYSALETTLAVLEDFRQVGKGLHSPAEGWSDPLSFAEYEPGEGRTVVVTLTDESAKLSLPMVKPEMLTELFKYWQVPQTEAERLTESLLGWMKKDYTPTAMGAPTIEDYESAPLPMHPPGRSLRSFSELAAIEGVRQAFFDEVTGTPTELYHRFTDTFSLYSFEQSNLNGNRLEPLLAQGSIDEQQQQQITAYLSGTGNYEFQGAGFFKNERSVAAVAGGQVARLGYGFNVHALRIIVTVRQDVSSYQLEAVVAPEGGAKVVTATRPGDKAGAIKESKTPKPEDNASSSSIASSATAKSKGGDLKYPFTFLEIHETNVVPASNSSDQPPLPGDTPTA